MYHCQEQAPLPHPVLLVRAYGGLSGGQPPKSSISPTTSPASPDTTRRPHSWGHALCSSPAWLPTAPQTSVRTPVLIPCGILAWPHYFICNISSSVEGREESIHLPEWV